MKITIDNYFESSKGQFKEVAPAIAEQLLSTLCFRREWVYPGEYKINLDENPEAQPVVLQGKTWTLNFISVSYDGSLSIYFTDGQRLIRISDHWSKGSLVNNCGYIRKCFWSFKRARNSKRIAWHDWIMQAGVVSLTTMKPL